MRFLARVGLFGVLAVGLLNAVAPSVAAATSPPHTGSTTPVTQKLVANTKSKVVSTFVQTSDKRNVLTTGWIDFSNTSASAVKATLTYYHQIKGGSVVVDKENELVQINANSHSTVPIGFQASGLAVGSYEFGVFAKPTASLVVAATTATSLAMGPDMPNGFKTRAVGNAVKLSTTPQAVLTGTVSFADGSVKPTFPGFVAERSAFAQGWVNVVGGTKKATVTLDYYMDSSYMGSVSQIIGPDQPVSVPFGLLCNGILDGSSHTFTVKASYGSGGGEGLVARSGFLSVAAVPLDGSMPINQFNGDGKPVALTTKAQQLMQTQLNLASTADAWMGGWMTLQNTATKARTVSIQAAMGGEAEGPLLQVKIPANGVLSVPFGLLCNGEPAGTLTLDVMLTASASGVNWNGDGHMTAWAVSP